MNPKALLTAPAVSGLIARVSYFRIGALLE
jgi:hypothetical protein